jgi:hypothetical protein
LHSSLAQFAAARSSAVLDLTDDPVSSSLPLPLFSAPLSSASASLLSPDSRAAAAASEPFSQSVSAPGGLSVWRRKSGLNQPKRAEHSEADEEAEDASSGESNVDDEMADEDDENQVPAGSMWSRVTSYFSGTSVMMVTPAKTSNAPGCENLKSTSPQLPPAPSVFGFRSPFGVRN